MWFKDDNDGAKAIEGLKDKYSLADGKGSDAVLKKYQVSRLDRRGYLHRKLRLVRVGPAAWAPCALSIRGSSGVH